MANAGIANIYKMVDNNRKDDKELYLFKIGKFFCCLGDDAYKIEKLLNLKITQFSKELKKAGFPEEVLEKYNKLIEENGYYFTIVIANEGKTYTYNEYVETIKENKNGISNNNEKNLVDKINNYDKLTKLAKEVINLDFENMSIKELFSFFQKIKKEAKESLLEK